MPAQLPGSPIKMECLPVDNQARLVALAHGFRENWLEPFQWERAWRGSDLSDEGVLGDARTWLARRPGLALDHRD